MSTYVVRKVPAEHEAGLYTQVATWGVVEKATSEVVMSCTNQSEARALAKILNKT